MLSLCIRYLGTNYAAVANNPQISRAHNNKCYFSLTLQGSQGSSVQDQGWWKSSWHASFVTEGEKRWQTTQMLLKLLLRGGTCHFHSHLTGQSKSRGKICCQGNNNPPTETGPIGIDGIYCINNKRHHTL